MLRHAHAHAATRSHRHARSFFNANAATQHGPAMLAHVTSKMKPVDSPIFSAYPLEVAPPPWSLTRLFMGAPAEYTPFLSAICSANSLSFCLAFTVSASTRTMSGLEEEELVALAYLFNSPRWSARIPARRS